MAFLTFTPDLTTDNAAATLHGLLRALRIRVTGQTVRNTVRSHPAYPSMLALSDALTEWRVDNTAIQLNSAEQLRELPLPLVAHQYEQGGRYVLVIALKGNFITYIHSERGSITESVASFEKRWTGVVLLAEANEQAGEADYPTKRRNEWLQRLRGPVVLAGISMLLLMTLLGVGPQLNRIDYGWLLTKAIGIFSCLLLMQKVLGNTGTLADRLCRLTSETNCDGVLNAPAAKLWGWLSWVDVGLLYFAGGLLAALTVGLVPTVRPVLRGLALISLPFVGFSLYYQSVVARQWCTLCLSVQVILLIEGLLAVTQLTKLPNTWQPYAVMLSTLLLPTLLWMIVKPLLISHQQGQVRYFNLTELQRDPNIFRTLLQKNEPMPPVIPDMHPVLLGDPRATHTITVVTNPYCGSCASKHLELKALLEKTNDVNIQVVFYCDETKGYNTQVALHIMALPQDGPAQTALTNWYSQDKRNFEDWAAAHPSDVDKIDSESVVYFNQDWSQRAQIEATPTLFINGQRIPYQYSLPDALRMVTYMSKQEMLQGI